MGDLHPGGLAVDVSNAALLRRCRDRDSVAWSALVRKYERLVYSIPTRLGLDSQSSADVTQATFAELLGAVDDIREPDRLSGWLVTVARRTSFRHIEKSRGTVSLGTHDEPLPDFSEQAVRAAEVLEAVHALGEPCRSLIEGLFFDDDEPDYATIATRIGRPTGSIGPLRGRCLSRLKDLLVADDDA